MPGCCSVAFFDRSGSPIWIALVAKRQAVAAWQIPTTFRRHSAEKRSENTTPQQRGKSRPFREAQRKEGPRKETQRKEPHERKPTKGKPSGRENRQQETRQKKGAAGGDPCRCDELFAWRAVTPPQAPPRRAPQRTPRPQRARCRDTPSLPGWTRRTRPHR